MSDVGNGGASGDGASGRSGFLHVALSRVVDVLRADYKLSACLGLFALCMVITACLFPGSSAGGIAFLVIVAGGGAGFALVWGRASTRVLPRWVTRLLCYGIPFAVGVSVFWSPWNDAIWWKTNDWGPHHAILRILVDGIESGKVPRWAQGINSGDAVFELYPSVTYYIAAHLAILFDSTDALPQVLARIGIITQVLTALAVVRLGRRLLPWPVAVAMGVMFLLDRGNVHSGGSRGLLLYGVLHHSVAQCFWFFALSSLVDCVTRPRLRTTVLFWLLAAAGTVTHPTGLVTATAAVVALAGVALFAKDVPRVRAVIGILHVVLAVSLAAWVWKPLVERLLLYAVVYGDAPLTTTEVFKRYMTLARSVPYSRFAMVSTLGLLGMLAGMFSRRAVPTYVAFLACILVVGATEHAYVLLDLVPTPGLSRFSGLRLLAIAKIPVFLCAGYALVQIFFKVAGRWPGGSRSAAGAMIALLALWIVRGALPLFSDEITQMRGDARAHVAVSDMEQLIEWAKARKASEAPDRFGRLLYEEKFNEIYHVNAETGLPVIALGSVSNLMIRDRIQDASPANLRRFNVRWIVRHGESPRRGARSTEQKVGEYRVREVRGWDGKFARIERGEGEAVVTQLDNHKVIVELSGTDKPALVVLGTGYYPRWRALDTAGNSVPVYAYPAVPGSKVHVVAAWLSPGVTVFSPNGPLPSDGSGTAISLLAALAMVCLVVVSLRRRWRLKLHRRMARVLGGLVDHRRLVGLGMTFLVGVSLLISGGIASRRPMAALQVGSALAAHATIEVREKGASWRACRYSAVRGHYSCGGLGVRDSILKILRTEKPSWPMPIPAIRLSGNVGIEFRITVTGNLKGQYIAAASPARVSIVVGDGAPVELRRQTIVSLTDSDDRQRIVIEGTMTKSSQTIALLRLDRVHPEHRHYPLPPDVAPLLKPESGRE